MSSSRGKPIRAFLAITIAIFAIQRTLFLEEEEEAEVGGEPGTFRKSTKSDLLRLPAPIRGAVAEIENRIEQLSRAAARRLRRHRAAVVASSALAGAVPVVAAAQGPAWLMAALGAGAAFTQIVPQLNQDHRIGVEHHALAVQMSSALRRFRIDVFGGLSAEDLRGRCRSLLLEIEDLDANATTRLLEILALAAEASAKPKG